MSSVSSSDDDGLYAFESEDGTDPIIISVGIDFPVVKRRKKLPDPVEKEKSVILWSMIKDNIGKGLTKICLPVYFNEPLSSLQKGFEDLEYSYLLDRAYEWGKRVTTSIYNLILGKLYVDHYGTMRIQGNHEFQCKLKFKEQSIIDRNPHQVQGVVQDKHGKTVSTMFGKWDESMHYVEGDCSGKGKFDSLSDARLLSSFTNSFSFSPIEAACFDSK